MFKNVFAVLALSLVMLTTACSKGPSKSDLANHLVDKVNAYNPGYNYSVAKLDTARGNWVVITWGSGGLTTHQAVNLDLINMNMDIAGMIAAINAAGPNGYATVTKTGTYGNYYIDVAGNVYEDTGAAPKDLEKAAAAIEMVRHNELAQKLSADFGLSEERSFHVAKMTMQWNKISKSRAMTEADVDAFSMDLIGMNVADAQTAFINAQAGDTASYDALMAQAASINGVSPEQMRQIVSQVIAQ